MVDVLRDGFGNPSSVHAEGAAAKAAIDTARAQVASLLAVTPAEVIFTGNATESNSALLAAPHAAGRPGRHIVTSSIEHPSIEASLAWLETTGWRVTRVPVDGEGRVDPKEFASALEDDTALCTLIWANNETGVLQPVAEIAASARERGIPMHSDATQAVGKIAVDARTVDFLSLSAHKLGGPKGVGCLVARDERAFEPLLRGGPQERRRRGGTENVAGIVGLGVACALAEQEGEERIARHSALRDRLWDGMQAKIPRVRRNGSVRDVLPNTLNVEFADAAGEVLVQALDLEGVAVSAGAACASGSIEPSRVLVAMGRTPEQSRGSVRWSVGHGVDESQIDRVLAILPDLVARAREAAGA